MEKVRSGDGTPPVAVHQARPMFSKAEIATGALAIAGLAATVFLAYAVFKGIPGLDALNHTSLGYGLFGAAAGTTTILGLVTLGIHMRDNYKAFVHQQNEEYEPTLEEQREALAQTPSYQPATEAELERDRAAVAREARQENEFKSRTEEELRRRAEERRARIAQSDASIRREAPTEAPTESKLERDRAALVQAAEQAEREGKLDPHRVTWFREIVVRANVSQLKLLEQELVMEIAEEEFSAQVAELMKRPPPIDTVRK